ncbi:MAG: hypothetical protein OHK0045_09270 [Raineya sp.]
MKPQIQIDKVLLARVVHLEGFFIHEDIQGFLEEAFAKGGAWIIRAEKAIFLSIEHLDWACAYRNLQVKLAFILPKEFFSAEKIAFLNQKIASEQKTRFFRHLLEARAWLFSANNAF